MFEYEEFEKFIQRSVIASLVAELEHPEYLAVIPFGCILIVLVKGFLESPGLVFLAFIAIHVAVFVKGLEYSKTMTQKQHAIGFYLMWMGLRMLFTGAMIVGMLARYYLEGNKALLVWGVVSLLWFPLIEFTRWNNNPYPSFCIRWILTFVLIGYWPGL